MIYKPPRELVTPGIYSVNRLAKVACSFQNHFSADFLGLSIEEVAESLYVQFQRNGYPDIRQEAKTPFARKSTLIFDVSSNYGGEIVPIAALAGPVDTRLDIRRLAQDWQKSICNQLNLPERTRKESRF